MYFIPETRAYQILGSTELFPQHCQLPNLTPHQHFCALTNELVDSTAIASAAPKGQQLIKLLQHNITKVLNPSNILEEQRVNEQMINKEQQRVIDDIMILTVPCMTDAPWMMQSQNPTAKRALTATPRLHQHVTWNNMPGAVPLLSRTQKSSNQNLLYQEMTTRSGSILVLPVPINFYSYTCNNA